MRTFHHIKLIREIADSPYEFIGQRRYALFRAFIEAYRQNTEVEYDIRLKDSFEKMPSIEEYVAKEFGEKHTRTVMFNYYLGWIAEDEREHYDLCLERIFRYEKEFPVNEISYTHKLRWNGNLDLQRSFKHVLLRSGMYGINKLSEIRAYLDGYFKFKSEYGLKLSTYEKRLQKFITKWKAKTDPSIQFDTWDRALTKHKMGTTDFTNMFTWEVERFEVILNEAIKMELEMPEGWKNNNG
jgi:hypothetical protein